MHKVVIRVDVSVVKKEKLNAVRGHEDKKQQHAVGELSHRLCFYYLEPVAAVPAPVAATAAGVGGCCEVTAASADELTADDVLLLLLLLPPALLIFLEEPPELGELEL